MWDYLLQALKAGNMVEAEKIIKLLTTSGYHNIHHANPSPDAPFNAMKIMCENPKFEPMLTRLINFSNYHVLYKNQSNDTLLHVQMTEKLIDVLLDIMDMNFIKSVNKSGDNALHYAVSRGSINLVKKLLNKSSELANTVNNWGATPLYSARNEEIINLLLDVMNPALVKQESTEGYTALHSIIGLADHQFVGNKLAIVKKILALEPELVDVITKDGKTVLHMGNGNRDVGEVLLEKIKPELIKNVDKEGRTALHYLNWQQGMDVIIKKILAREPNLANIINKDGQSALHNASDDLIAEVLLTKMNLDVVKAIDNEGNTALHCAVRGNNFKVAGGYYPKAIKSILHAKDKDIDDPTIIKFLSGSIDHFHSLILKAPELADNYYKQANILLGLNRKEEAVKRYEKAIELDSKYAEKFMTDAFEILVGPNADNKIASQIAIKYSCNNVNKLLQGKHDLKTADTEKTTKEPSSISTKVTSEKNNDLLIQAANVLATPKIQENLYSNKKIVKLLNLQLEGPNVVADIVNFKQGKLSANRVEALLKPVLEDGKTGVIALHLHGKSWASLVLKKQADETLQVIYNDPRGVPFVQEKNVKSLINNIRNLEEKTAVLDLRQTQQLTDNDSAPMVIDNLVTLTKVNTNGMQKSAIQQLLSKQNQINNIKQKRFIIEDTNPWYSDSKFDKLLHLRLDDKEQISIAPVTVFEHKELLVANVTIAAKEVMESGKIAIMPIHIHNNHWTALVIKKHANGSLQVLYNDPKGNSLMSEKNSGALLKAISKINSEFTVIDMQLKQQSNDDDCGPFTVENLIMLATSDTNNLHKNQLQKLLQIDNNNDAQNIRNEHSSSLTKAGIPVANNSQKTNYFFNLKEIESPEVEFIPVTPPNNDEYGVKAMGEI